MKTKPLITVIVPVYKVEPYLSRCVGSILSQTFSDFDLVLVDDGSPDNCGKICDEYARQDKRIHVIHQANGGLSAARNTAIEWALEYSNSQWLTFIDSDDWVHPEMLELMLNAVNFHKTSVAVAKMRLTTDFGNTELNAIDRQTKLRNVETVYSDQDINVNAAWGKLFKKDLFKNIRFPVGKLHEDRFTTYKLLFQFTELAVVPAPLYNYFTNPEGIIHSEWNIRRLDCVEAVEEQLEFFKNSPFQDTYTLIQGEYIKILLYSLRQLKRLHPKYKTQTKQLTTKLRSFLWQNAKKLGLAFRKNINIYKYACPVIGKIMRRVWRNK